MKKAILFLKKRDFFTFNAFNKMKTYFNVHSTLNSNSRLKTKWAAFWWRGNVFSDCCRSKARAISHFLLHPLYTSKHHQRFIHDDVFHVLWLRVIITRWLFKRTFQPNINILLLFWLNTIFLALISPFTAFFFIFIFHPTKLAEFSREFVVMSCYLLSMFLLSIFLLYNVLFVFDKRWIALTTVRRVKSK